MTIMATKPLKDAEEYIENNMKADNGNMGLIAWRFLVGCRILESLEDMMGAPKQGDDVNLEYINLDHANYDSETTRSIWNTRLMVRTNR